METQRILMRSLAVVVFASVIWTITVSAGEIKPINCCRAVSKTKLTDPIISFRVLKASPTCLKAVVFKTERGEFCLDWRQPWVKEEIKLLRAQRNKSLTSTPPPASSISKLTPVGVSFQSTDKSTYKSIYATSAAELKEINQLKKTVSAEGKGDEKVGNQKLINCCTAVSRLTREQLTDPIIGFRMLNKSPPCLKAVVFETERGEFCLDWRQPWVKEEVKLFFETERGDFCLDKKLFVSSR